MTEKTSNEAGDLSSIIDSEPGAKDEANAELEKKAEDLNNKLLEERFTWILLSIIVIDIFVFMQMESWSGPVVIGILELIVIVITADKCKIEAVAPLIDKLTGFAGNLNKRE